jgi:hypothetical protein
LREQIAVGGVELHAVVYFAILTVIFGPLIFMAFLRWLSKRVRRHVTKAEILPPDEWLRKYGLKRPSSPKWALPERTVGEHWKN